jgi:hypothetical protein
MPLTIVRPLYAQAKTVELDVSAGMAASLAIRVLEDNHLAMADHDAED